MEITIAAINPLIPKLSSLLVGEFTLEKRMRKSIASLLTELTLMHAFICKVARVPPEQLDEGVKLWAATVREFSYKMVYIIDAIMVHVEDGGDSANLNTNLLKKTIRLFKKGKDLHWNALEEAVGQAKELAELRQRNKLINMLIEGDDWSKHPLKIISIVGFGGLGKTTLAKVVYDKIKGQFDCGAFISVCQNPNMKKVLQNILYGLDKNKYGDNNQKAKGEKELIDELIEFLNGKRYLIVIDDIWNENEWQPIKRAFHRRNSPGSRIINTTRIVSLCEACCSSSDDIYQMEPLSDDESRKLLFDRMFGSVRRCPREFEQVSSDILKKCAGVPLAIISMASILAGDLWMKPKDELHLFLKSIGQGLRNDCWENMQRILSLSYYDLPSHLKTCLLYLSTFPVAHPIERERLVKKLIAEGIIVTTKECNLEDLSSSYLNEFVNRNVIHPLECNKDGEVISYHIHPMMHDILKSIAIKEKFAASLDDKDISRLLLSAHDVNFRHLSIDCADSESLTYISSMAFDGCVRSLTVFGHANRFLLRHFEGIRILDLEGCKSIERADLEYICNMALLKQLWLTNTEITKLPPEIGNLHYLEGLDVRGTQITKLPPQIVRLTRLVHLLISEGVKLPDGIGKMTSLQQLGTIDPRKCSASSLKELAEHPYLKEITVVLTNKPEDTRMNDVLFSSLDKSTELRSLVVCSDFRLRTVKSTSYNLDCRKKLTVVRTSLKIPDAIAENHFLILRVLDIRVCKLQEDDLKILQEMPRLQSLVVRLEVLPKQMIRISCAGFAKLESFCVDCRMPRVMFKEGAMPKLEHLELKVYGGTASEEHMGINHLLNLQKVTLRYSKWYATNKGVRETTEAVKTESKEHQNEITLCIAEEEKNGICNTKTAEVFQENKDARCTSMITEIKQEDGHAGWTAIFDGDGTQEGCIHQSRSAIASSSRMTEIKQEAECKEHQNEISLCIAEENKDGTCTMKTDIFQENRVASCSRVTEIEEEEDTQDGGLHQSSHDIASCSRTSEIEEVVE